MSLKVYTGIKFKSKNLNEILGQLNSIKEQAIKNVIEYYINNQTPVGKFILSKNFDESYINKVTDCISEQKVNNDTMSIFVKTFKSSMAKDYVDWTDIYATFIVHIIPYKGKYYGYYTCGDIKENEKLLFQFVEDFHYQNQTDKPDDITTREWNKRAEVWNTVFYENENDYTGLQFRIIDHNTINPWDIEKIFKSFIEKHRIGYSMHFLYETYTKFENKFQAIDVFNEETNKLRKLKPSLDIRKYDVRSGENGNIVCEYIVVSSTDMIEKTVEEVVDILGVTTVKEEMYTNKKQIFYEIK